MVTTLLYLISSVRSSLVAITTADNEMSRCSAQEHAKRNSTATYNFYLEMQTNNKAMTKF